MEQYNKNNKIQNSYDTEQIFYIFEGDIQELEIPPKTKSSQLEKNAVAAKED